MALTPILTINVKDPTYGAIGDGVNDDTAAIQAAITAAAYTASVSTPAPFVASGPTLYFPPGKYMISSGLTLSGLQSVISILGDNAILVPKNPATFTSYAIHHSWCYDVKIEGLNFLDFKKALKLENNNLDSCQVKISRCAFHRNEESINIRLQSSFTEIEGCKFTDNLVSLNIVRSDKTVMRDCWITPQAYMPGKDANNNALPHLAPIVNHGRLTMENCLLVPLQQAEAIEPAWINNYGCITVKDTRQGGEPHSMTLINNFAPVGNTHSWNDGDQEVCTVIVTNSWCFGTYNGPNTSPSYKPPTIVRYVDKIPNMTNIENNCGMIYTRLVGFSLYKYQDNTNLIRAMINASGTVIDPTNVTVRIENNVGGVPYDHGSHVPIELYPYARNSVSLWPSKKTYNLELLDKQVQVDGSIVFKFKYPYDFISNAVFLINYSGCPLLSGSSYYRGGYVGLLRANGFWSNPGNIGKAREALVLEPLMNQIGDTDPASWPTGTFDVEAYWEATSDRFLPYDSTNKVFCIKVAGRTGAQNDSWLDQIVVTSLDNLQFA